MERLNLNGVIVDRFFRDGRPVYRVVELPAIRNVVKLEDGGFDIEYEHPVLGWIPFTSISSDEPVHARAIYRHLKETHNGK